jgi:hypothetical protein
VQHYEECVAKVLEYSLVEKKRKFQETIELQIMLKGYDPSKDKRFNGTVKLPFPCRYVLLFYFTCRPPYDSSKSAAVMVPIHLCYISKLIICTFEMERLTDILACLTLASLQAKHEDLCSW